MFFQKQQVLFSAVILFDVQEHMIPCGHQGVRLGMSTPEKCVLMIMM